MRKKYITIGFIVVALALATKTYASLGQFAGKWKNIDSNTRGIATLVIKVTGTQVNFRAWGKCHPNDCDWGTVKAVAYASNVSENLIQKTKALSATFKTNFSRTLMIIRPLRGKRLQAQVFTQFTGNSQRTDYNSVYTFARASVRH